MPQISPVLIVGTGPSGLVLALTLVKNGVPVHIIEKETNPRIGQRGPGIQPRSLELFRMLRVTEIEQRSISIPPLYCDEQPGEAVPPKIVEMTARMEPTPGFPYLRSRMLGQNTADRILRVALAAYGCNVEYGAELRTFSQHDDTVTVHIAKVSGSEETMETREYQWVVGTDGAHSVVRKQLGLSFLGETREGQRMIIGDITLKGFTSEYWYMYGTPATSFVSLRPTDEGDSLVSFTIVAPEFDHARMLTDRDQLIKCIQSVSKRTDLKFGDIAWISEYRANIRMVDKFGEGRVFVAGDAAHCHSPTGGQGLNSSIQDSFNLAWKLALVHRGLAPRTLLDSYNVERLPIIAAMLQRTTFLLDKTFSAYTDQEKVWDRGGKLLQLAVNYRGSPIVVDESDGLTTSVDELRTLHKLDITVDERLRAGDRASDAPGLVNAGTGRVVRLFDVFDVAAHTVLVFAGGDCSGRLQPLVEAVKKYPQGTVLLTAVLPQASASDVGAGADVLLLDKEGHAFRGYGVSDERTTVVVVRPDGVIGAIVEGVVGLRRYFDGIFRA